MFTIPTKIYIRVLQNSWTKLKLRVNEGILRTAHNELLTAKIRKLTEKHISKTQGIRHSSSHRGGMMNVQDTS